MRHPDLLAKTTTSHSSFTANQWLLIANLMASASQIHKNGEEIHFFSW
jgi:hypothetical protein